MPKKAISLAPFELPFMKDPYESYDEAYDPDDYEAEDPDHDEIFEAMENSLPKTAHFLGSIKDEVNNFTSWQIDTHYYSFPVETSKHQFALIQIRWDDNWGRWEWSSCAQASGYENEDEAALAMAERLFDSWDIDLECEPYAEFLDGLRAALNRRKDR